jgi:hypothetical protein
MPGLWAIECAGKFLCAIDVILLHTINFVCNGMHRKFFVANETVFTASKFNCWR